MGINTLTKTTGDADAVAGGPKLPFCSEVWDAISRYIYTVLQGGSIMKGWMKREKRDDNLLFRRRKVRPIIFNIERIDCGKYDERWVNVFKSGRGCRLCRRS